ncbi:MAG TPA: DUF4857 domain-containing protein, partial [Paludibacteraceae bacterium]|nr:DUF4857 domain-containing protein [Paludibacteraceae bacterium]
MSKTYKIIYYILLTAILAWLLPWLYNLATLKRERTPFALYSEIIEDFAMINVNQNEKDLRYTDRKGNFYTEMQFDSILPMFYYRQLVTDNRLPDTVQGVPITAPKIRRENFIFRSRPADINVHNPKLYPLLESRSKRVDLTMPDDVFRLTKNGIEFIDMESNRVNREKSALFQSVFQQKEVAFPIQTIAGNPTNRKEYDEGYLFTDNEGKLFHLKRMQGRPFLRPIPIDAEIDIAQIWVTEFSNRKYFGFLTDVNNNFYALTAPDYKLKKVEIPPFNPKKENMTIFGNMFTWTVVQTDKTDEILTAIDAKTFTAIDSMAFSSPEKDKTGLASYLFPLQ